jgi:hypothetical protein
MRVAVVDLEELMVVLAVVELVLVETMVAVLAKTLPLAVQYASFGLV